MHGVGISSVLVRKKEPQRQKVELVRNLWTEMFTCRGCLGHIPSYKYDVHVKQCAVEKALSAKGFITASGLTEPIPITICAHLLDPTNMEAGFCGKDRDVCTKHKGWQTAMKDRIEKDSYLLNRRLHLVDAELAYKHTLRISNCALRSETYAIFNV